LSAWWRRSVSGKCAVCAREVSRFARNSREWQQLVEVCRIVDTLLVDQETVYSPLWCARSFRASNCCSLRRTCRSN
jgi:DNA invertase Pin-like site-specific DNA recombinase